jgi:hypothetical protein
MSTPELSSCNSQAIIREEKRIRQDIEKTELTAVENVAYRKQA